jgi:hypothetical protein
MGKATRFWEVQSESGFSESEVYRGRFFSGIRVARLRLGFGRPAAATTTTAALALAEGPPAAQQKYQGCENANTYNDFLPHIITRYSNNEANWKVAQVTK